MQDVEWTRLHSKPSIFKYTKQDNIIIKETKCLRRIYIKFVSLINSQLRKSMYSSGIYLAEGRDGRILHSEKLPYIH